MKDIDAGKAVIPDQHALRTWIVIVAAAGVVLLGVAFFSGAARDQLAYSYLVAFLYWLTIALGSLFFVLVQFLTRAGWSVVVRRLAEHAMGTLPLMLLLALPLAFLGHELYPFLAGQEVQGGGFKAWYLGARFFSMRGFVYLFIWALIGWWFRRQSMRQDTSGELAITVRLQSASAPILAVFAVTITFASFDWIMGLDPDWYSTIFGVYFFSGAVVAVFAFLIFEVALLKKWELLGRQVSEEHFHDLGKLLFGFVAFWAYIAFSQYLAIWYANLPEETAYYATRMGPGWMGFTHVLAVGHFVVPFFLLLSRSSKRRVGMLTFSALWVLVMHYLDLYWLVMPHLHPEGLGFHWLDLVTLAGTGGIFLAGVGWLALGAALVPVKDPRLHESLAFESLP
jgi:hypothetical protein